MPADPGADKVTVVATGGYGRGLLAPGSDIDLLFLLPAKQTPWGESVVEYMLYLLWDLRFKVGHATRTVEQCLKMAQADMTIRTALLDSRLLFGDPLLFDELAEAISRRGRRRQREGRSSKPNSPSATNATGGPAKAATRSSPTSRTARAACAICTRCIGSPPIIHGADATSPHSEARIFSPAEARAFRRCGGLPVDHPLPPAFPHRARRRAADLRHAATDGRAARLRRPRRPARRRALHEALLPDRQGSRRSDDDAVCRRSKCSS